LLLYWSFEKSEQRRRIRREDVIEKIQQVGLYLSERHHHHQEWFTSIQPIADTPPQETVLEQLREEFFSGVSARYEHILAGLDFYHQ